MGFFFAGRKRLSKKGLKKGDERADIQVMGRKLRNRPTYSTRFRWGLMGLGWKGVGRVGPV